MIARRTFLRRAASAVLGTLAAVYVPDIVLKKKKLKGYHPTWLIYDDPEEGVPEVVFDTFMSFVNNKPRENFVLYRVDN
jgi:hypothetical protein